MLTREDVVWGYRFLLDRDPESEAVIDGCRALADRATMRRLVTNSPEYLAKNGLGGGDLWVYAPVFGGQRLLGVNLADRYVSLGCMHDSYEPHETEIIRRLLSEGDHFVDIGANIGWFTMLASTIVGNGGQIDAFEPRPQTFKHLSLSVAINELQDHVTVHQLGLSNMESSMMLSWAQATDNPGGSSLTHNPLSAGSEGVAVSLVTLDSMALPRCDVIKIDIEGAEYLAMQGAKQTLAKHRPYILSELHPSQLHNVSRCSARDYIAYMNNQGYRCYLVDANAMGRIIEDYPENWHRELINVVFLPTEKADVIAPDLFSF